MTAPDLLVCPSCNRQKEEFWPDGFCGPDVCLNPDCNSQVAAPAPDAAFASGFKAGLKAAAEHWFRGVSGVRQLLPETKAQILAIPCPQPAPTAQLDAGDVKEAWEKAYWRMRSYAVHDNDCKLNKPPRFDGPCSCGLTAALEEALALISKGATEPTEYERKVAQMKKDFPNGI